MALRTKPGAALVHARTGVRRATARLRTELDLRASRSDRADLAIFHEHAARLGVAPQAERRVHVLGSDIDARSLEAAERGTFEESDFSETPSELRRRYFAPTPPFTIVPEVRRMVRFERRDLLAEEPPPGTHHLICCRNVLIYFDRETQERLFQKFRDALAPAGFLVLGKVETLLGAARVRFVAVDGRERIFRPQ